MMRFPLYICLLLSFTAFSQERRLALVIGNSDYEHAGELANPINDAYGMQQALSQLGFEVMEYFNLDEGELKEAIDEFGLKLKSFDVGLFFYAGHGIQAKGENYLIPVDANLMSEQQVEYDCVEAGRVLSHMDVSGAKVNIMILDACRNNPFERSWTRSSSGKGLAFMTAPTGTLIAYATAPGSTASDGTGRNGLYTEAILENMHFSGITIIQLFQNVRMQVSQRSNNQQIPWESTSLIGDFYLNRDSTKINLQQCFTKAESPTEEFSIERLGAPDSLHSGVFIDVRDNQKYSWVRIGVQVWMSENLNYNSADSWDNENYKNDRKIYGRLYKWKAAITACPDGWHLPSDEEWKILEMQLGMLRSTANAHGYRGKDEGGKLKNSGTSHWADPNFGATNTSGFNALPGGIRNSGTYFYPSEQAYFWSSTSKFLEGVTIRVLGFDEEKIGRTISVKNAGLSVRCVKDSP